jgi:hypothetical protein
MSPENGGRAGKQSDIRQLQIEYYFLFNLFDV